MLKSWALPKGPSLNPKEKHLAVRVEDHPYEYRNFEGTIAAGNYGAGDVIVWDSGTYEPAHGDGESAVLKALRKGALSVRLHGKKLNGEFALSGSSVHANGFSSRRMTNSRANAT